MKDLDKERELILESLDLLLEKSMETSFKADELRKELKKCKEADKEEKQ